MALILIADDDADLRLLIRETLALADPSYGFLEVDNGEKALEMARREKPDIILLDIVMPRMDGLAVCRILKNDPELKFVPIVFITALKDSEEKIRGVDVGGDDFLIKPFMPLELVLRVRSLLRVKELHDELNQRYLELQEAHEELKRLAQWKDDLTNMIIHDMRTPLSSTLLGLGFVLQDNQKLAEPYKTTLEIAHSSIGQLTKMVDNLLDISRMERGKLELNHDAVPLANLVSERVRELEPLAKVDGKSFVVDLPQELPDLWGDRSLLSRVLANLMDNALYHAERESQIRVSARREPSGEGVEITVHNRGKPIPAEFKEIIFQKFRQVEKGGLRKGRGVGLGLAFCKMAVEAHGGQIWMDSDAETGTTFHVALPSAPA